MAPSNPSAKADALMPLAQGMARREVAEQVGVAPSTVAGWLRNPAYAAEVAKLKEAIDAKPLDPDRVYEVLGGCRDRVRGVTPAGAVSVSIPPGSSPRKARQLLARGIARALTDRGDL